MNDSFACCHEQTLHSKYIQHILIKKFCATNMSLLPYSNNIQILLSGARLEDSAGIHESYQKWQ